MFSASYGSALCPLVFGYLSIHLECSCFRFPGYLAASPMLCVQVKAPLLWVGLGSSIIFSSLFGWPSTGNAPSVCGFPNTPGNGSFSFSSGV